jgi:CheY-like chemotaxis protein
MSAQDPVSPTEEFTHSVNDALSQLYDSAALQSLPLGKALFPSESNPLRRSQLLRKILLDAIHSLEPGPGVPGGAPDRRLYRLVEMRFIEGLDPNEAMTRLALAKSQFYRDQARAVEMLSAAVWAQRPAQSPQSTDPRSSLLHAEVERISPRGEAEHIDAIALAGDLRQIIQPLAEDRHVEIGEFSLEAINHTHLDRVLLRQALLTALISVLDLPGLQVLNLSSRQSLDSRSAQIGATLESPLDVPAFSQQETLEACRLLVDALGGILQVSAEAVEIRVQISWPVVRARQLLVIDDNAGMGDLFRLYLKSANWSVLSASDGREARAILRENRPDAIILDILIPQEDGWELLRAFKGDETSCAIPVVICSVLKQPQVAIKLGAAAYVEKPVGQQTLLDTLNRIISTPPG